MAEATASASPGSSGWPLAIEASSCLNDAFGSRWRWTAIENTFSPKMFAFGCVRSAWPSAPPFGLHWAALTLGVRVRVGIAGVVLLRIRDSAMRVCRRARRLLVPVSKLGHGRFALGSAHRLQGEVPRANLRHGDKEPPPAAPETGPDAVRQRRLDAQDPLADRCWG